MTMVKTTSMLFGGGSNQRSADIFRQGSRLGLEFVYVCFGGVGVFYLSLHCNNLSWCRCIVVIPLFPFVLLC
jgi:hypothetical protein